MATKKHSTKSPENPLEWYWKDGLHDAGIIGIEAFEFPFDYNKFVGEKNKYNRNILVLKINAKVRFMTTPWRKFTFTTTRF